LKKLFINKHVKVTVMMFNASVVLMFEVNIVINEL